MSKGGGGGGSSTTVQKADPWIGLQPALKELYGGALTNYQGGGPRYYGGQTNAGSNSDIESSLNQGWNASQNNSNQLSDTISKMQWTGAGPRPWENPAYQELGRFGGGAHIGSNPGQAGLQYFANGGATGDYSGENVQQHLANQNGGFSMFGSGANMNQNTANPFLNDEANGKYLSEKTNPYLRGMFDNASSAVTDQFKNAIAPGLASQFSAAGRTGSGAALGAFDNASGTLGRTLANTANSIYGGAYDAERGRQQNAIGMLSNNYNTERGMQMQGLQNQLGAAQGLSNLQMNKNNMRLQGANNLANLNSTERAQQLQGVQMQTNQYGMDNNMMMQARMSIPGLQAANQQNFSNMMGVGQFRQGQQQDQINADKARWDFNENMPNQRLQMLNQLLQGGAAYSGSTSTGNQAQNRNPFASALGGASMASGLGGAMGGNMGAMLGGPWGLLGGALLGGLFG